MDIPNTFPTRPTPRFLSLFGSGETSSVGRKIHESVLRRISPVPVEVAILSTPAGFQPNVSTVTGDIAQYFRTSLGQFVSGVSVIRADTRKDADNPEIFRPLETARYIFIGPGSPTYAVRNLEGTALMHTLCRRIGEDASLALSSAAVLAASQFCLPVYEIFKVGSPLFWMKGLDILSHFRGPTTVIPHFNNTEGGKKTDTSRCYVGTERFSHLMHIMPPSTDVVGIDEQTALITDIESGSREILGKGTVHPLP